MVFEGDVGALMRDVIKVGCVVGPTLAQDYTSAGFGVIIFSYTLYKDMDIDRFGMDGLETKRSWYRNLPGIKQYHGLTGRLGQKLL